jgi:hypothetical protein
MREGQQPVPGPAAPVRSKCLRPADVIPGDRRSRSAGFIPGDRRSRPAGVIPGDRRSRSGRGSSLSRAMAGRIIAAKGWIPFPALRAAGDDAGGVYRILVHATAEEGTSA